MSEERDRLEQRLDEAFASMRPGAGFEAGLWGRIRARRGRAAWLGGGTWAALGAAAAVLLVGFAGFFGYLTLGRGSGSPASRPAAGAAQMAPGAVRAASFGRLPRPGPSAQPVEGSAGTGAAPDQAAGPALGRPTGGPLGQVARYREPSASDFESFARSLGATGSGSRYSGSDFTLVFFPSRPDLGLQSHYVLTVGGAAPVGPAPGPDAARAAARTFLDQHHIPRPASAPAVTAEGPAALVSFPRPPGNPLTVLVAGDGRVLVVDGPLPLQLEIATYPLASPDQLREAARAAPADAVRMVVVLALDGAYGYYEPAALFTSADGRRTLVPAVAAGDLQ